MTFDPTFHADAVLRAAGSRLANYTLNGSREAIVDAVSAVYAAGQADAERIDYALRCIANPDWSYATADDMRELARKALGE